MYIISIYSLLYTIFYTLYSTYFYTVRTFYYFRAFFNSSTSSLSSCMAFTNIGIKLI